MGSFGLALLMLIATISSAQDSFQRVDIRDLDRNPQRFWARGIVFEDVLTAHPRGSTVRLDNQTYERLRTGTLGDVYATASAADKLRKLPLQKSYLFSGTVLQQEAGMTRRWMRGSRDFLYIVQDVSVPVEAFTEAVDDLEAMQAAVLKAEEGAVPLELKPVLDVLRAVEQGLFSFAQENGIEVAELFDPESEFAEMPARLALQEIRRMERTQGFSVQLFLADYSISLLRRRYRPDDAIVYADVRLRQGDEAEEDRMEVAALPLEPQEDWSAWFAATDDIPPPAAPIEEEPPAEVMEPEPPATLRIEGARTEEILPEPIEEQFDEILLDDLEHDEPELIEEEEPAPSVTEQEFETLVLETPWELPAPAIEVPVVVDADLEEFPGLHDDVASRPWQDEPIEIDEDESSFDVVQWLGIVPEAEPTAVYEPEPYVELEHLPPFLEDRGDLPETDPPELLPFPIPGTAPIPEPEPEPEPVVDPPVEEVAPSSFISVGPFLLPLPTADFLLDPDADLAEE